MNLKKWIVMFLCIVITVSVSACGSKSKEQNASNGTDKSVEKSTQGPMTVYVTFNAMKELTEAIGKEHIKVETIIPNGTEPHDFEPKAKDLEGLSNAKILVYSGLGMETWIDKAINAVNNKDLIVVEASNGAEVIENTDQEEIEEHGKYDPHIWLSLKGAETEVKNIKDALIQADSTNKNDYEKNYKDFMSKSESLYQEYSNKFKSVENKKFVTGHAAFGYLCRDFGLEQNSVEDMFASGEPSAQQMAELTEYCKSNNVGTIFAEEMENQEVSETLAKEVGAKVESIYTMESSEDGLDYFERMQSNLLKIYDSLK